MPGFISWFPAWICGDGCRTRTCALATAGACTVFFRNTMEEIDFGVKGGGGIRQSSSNSIMIIMPFCKKQVIHPNLNLPFAFLPRPRPRYDHLVPHQVTCQCRTEGMSLQDRQYQAQPRLRLPLPVGDKLLCTWTALEGFCLRSSSRFSSSWCLRGKLKYLNSEGIKRFYVGGNDILKVVDELYKCALTRTSTCRFELEFMMKSGLISRLISHKGQKFQLPTFERSVLRDTVTEWRNLVI